MEFLNDFFGIVVYSIESNGCLNGLWTNIDKGGEIFNEIAKKKDPKEEGISGDYLCTYIDCTFENLELSISWDDDKEYYIFKWELKDKLKFKGKGFQIGRQLIVTYLNN